jgi:hypothetical protein
MYFKDFFSYSLGSSQGIIFCLPSREWFIPNGWLLRSEMNEKGTELRLYYTHSIVTICGVSLGHLHESIARFELSAVREVPPSPSIKGDDMRVDRIEITEKASE